MKAIGGYEVEVFQYIHLVVRYGPTKIQGLPKQYLRANDKMLDKSFQSYYGETHSAIWKKWLGNN